MRTTCTHLKNWSSTNSSKWWWSIFRNTGRHIRCIRGRPPPRTFQTYRTTQHLRFAKSSLRQTTKERRSQTTNPRMTCNRWTCFKTYHPTPTPRLTVKINPRESSDSTIASSTKWKWRWVPRNRPSTWARFSREKTQTSQASPRIQVL